MLKSILIKKKSKLKQLQYLIYIEQKTSQKKKKEKKILQNAKD